MQIDHAHDPKERVELTSVGHAIDTLDTLLVQIGLLHRDFTDRNCADKLTDN